MDFFLKFLFACVAFTILFAMWLLPAIIADGNRNSKKIFWLNLFLGWFPVVWLVLLLAALLGERADQPKK